MTMQGIKRKLAAILSAGVVGYSLLMVDDEAATVSTLNAYRQVMTDLMYSIEGGQWILQGIIFWLSFLVWWMRCNAR